MSLIIKAAGGLVINERDELLMIYRKGHWDLPKGKLDEGETLEACAVREVEEETGLQNVQLKKLIGSTNHEYVENNTSINKETHWYLMQVSGEQQLIPQVEEDITNIRWIHFNDLDIYLNNSYDNIRYIVNQYVLSK